MTEKIEVLDHGYIQYVEHWGSDERIIEAARMSTNKGFNGWGPIHTEECQTRGQYGCTSDCNGGKPGDEKLLGYLWDHKHATPFEMAGAVIEVQAPIFVFREWHRHRTQSYNEMSARYTPLPDMNYIPTVERLMINAGGSNKQAGTVKGADVLEPEMAGKYREWLTKMYEGQQQLYEDVLSMGIPKELARIHLPVGRYSRMRASANLRNWLGFLTLRMEQGAQWEIRQYANTLHTVLSKLFPRTLALFDKGLK